MNVPTLLVQTSVDQDADGVFETIISDTYSADNKILTSVLDSDADGQADAVTSYTYNNSGDQTGLFFDDAADGSIDYSFTTDYITDADGVLTVTSTSRDGTGNDEIYVAKFDSDGNLIEEAAGPADGDISLTATYAYNAAGQITAYESRSGDAVRNRTEYTYNETGNESGQISGFSFFFGSDNIPFATGEYTYDEAGNLVRQETNSAGINRFVETYTYDDMNQLVESISTNSTRGSNSSSGLMQYEYNAAGQITSYLDKPAVPGQAATFYSYEYDEAGNLVEEVFDANNDGTPESITQYGYDAAGRIASQSLDTNADGIVDSTSIYAYDDLITGGLIQTSAVSSESDSSEFDSLEASMFPSDLLTKTTLGASDEFSGSEALVVSNDLLVSPALLGAEPDYVL